MSPRRPSRFLLLLANPCLKAATMTAPSSAPAAPARVRYPVLVHLTTLPMPPVWQHCPIFCATIMFRHIAATRRFLSRHLAFLKHRRLMIATLVGSTRAKIPRQRIGVASTSMIIITRISTTTMLLRLLLLLLLLLSTRPLLNPR